MIATEEGVAGALSGAQGGVGIRQALRKVAEEAEKPEGGVEVQAKASEEIDIDRLTTDSEDAPVIRIVNLIMVQAIRENASDIHIERSEERRVGKEWRSRGGEEG